MGEKRVKQMQILCSGCSQHKNVWWCRHVGCTQHYHAVGLWKAHIVNAKAHSCSPATCSFCKSLPNLLAQDFSGEVPTSAPASPATAATATNTTATIAADAPATTSTPDAASPASTTTPALPTLPTPTFNPSAPVFQDTEINMPPRLKARLMEEFEDVIAENIQFLRIPTTPTVSKIFSLFLQSWCDEASW
eukprot:TRINITY_DN5289_c0_g1_i3.p1 TRINITY_DN5289_c0_g1~~TRINITY_DN5289_c0_g1_i3.p1  ORF type:complete len:221 (-),score=42.09 TRINITY_DN5289_c0_g1_i3:485-1057(-)